MSYKKAVDVLPEHVLSLIQNYLDGEYIYIPKKNNSRKKWGELTRTREALSDRNIQIYNDFLKGISIRELSEMYYLAPKTLQKIISKIKVSKK